METDTSETSTPPNNPAFLHVNTHNIYKHTCPCQIPDPAHQNFKCPISPSVSRPLSFIHRATAVLGRRTGDLGGWVVSVDGMR
ncbi:hypothetical protein N7516_002520 [Penicillium verrucosum]|uniref:uncharacterized protein n=1 Tax=Penicillium verrucosum TaxID=60171 RepID=UPI0025456D16|nr:uncharacterized protein N7516_002520 [Penicillium verrucosum]KAJ5942352.1 hypothetical protein N7516_002520 [Penicillium verrucosum]